MQNINLPIISILLCVYLSGCTRCPLDESPGTLTDVSEEVSLVTALGPAQEWPEKKLLVAKEYANGIGSSAVIVMHNFRVVAEWGKTNLKMNSHEIRLSLMSALYGIAVQKDLIDISKTLAELNIDDRPPVLTTKEKQATIEDLLKSRSGVYHDAALDTKDSKSKRPYRGAYDPGTYWYYNNWDFNVLITIFEQETKMKMGEAFFEWIAKPIGMQDFEKDDIDYVFDIASDHPAYPVWISTRDLARFAQLYLNDGNWQNKQIIRKSWKDDSIKLYSATSSDLDNSEYFGYLWWLSLDGSYQSRGEAEQKIIIDPINNMIIVHRHDTCHVSQKHRPTSEEVDALFEKILKAHPDNNI